MKELIGRVAQGEITIIKIDALPEMTSKTVERVAKGHIISHSESGNNHLLTGGDVIERTSGVPEGMRMLYAVLESPEELIQDAAGNPHGAHALPPGVYEFRIAREYDPFAEQARQVAD